MRVMAVGRRQRRKNNFSHNETPFGCSAFILLTSMTGPISIAFTANDSNLLVRLESSFLLKNCISAIDLKWN
jgi:hypothetical protein